MDNSGIYFSILQVLKQDYQLWKPFSLDGRRSRREMRVDIRLPLTHFSKLIIFVKKNYPLSCLVRNKRVSTPFSPSAHEAFPQGARSLLVGWGDQICTTQITPPAIVVRYSHTIASSPAREEVILTCSPSC